MIDAHSHIGADSFHSIKGSVKEYTRVTSKLGIKTANLMPVPCPRYVSPQLYPGKEMQSLVWAFENSVFVPYRRVFEKDGRVTLIKNPINPYQEYNALIAQEIKEAKGMSLNFIPLVHPTLDSLSHLEELISNNPRAIKIHGVAAGISPKEISQEFWDMIFNSKVPLIIHTDYLSGGKPRDSLEHMYSENMPLNWITILEKQNIKAFLTHGARLCPESIERVRQSSNFLLGIAPDILLASEPERLYNSQDYLSNLITSAGVGKIALDLDYPWNIQSRDNNLTEWGAIDRLRNILSKEELEQVTLVNASSFFKI